MSDPALLSAIPENPNAEAVTPNCHLILSSPTVMAFLDIMPMTPGHILLCTRPHRPKASDLLPGEGADIGFWLPLVTRMVCRVVGVEDWNVVQNNGERAAQVVPHVHFHIIPRPQTDGVPDLRAKSWTMFGRGMREDLDDEEAAKLAAEMRRVLSEVVEEHEVAEQRRRGKL